MIRYVFAAVLAAFSIAHAQTITLSGPASARIGERFTLDLSSSTPGAVAYQWTLSLPTGLSVYSSSTAVANKQIYCNQPGLRCLIVGATPPNVAVIPAGKIASLVIAVQAGAPLGIVALGLNGTLAADASANAIAVTGGSFTINVLNPKYDITGDGKVDSSDVAAIAGLVADNGSCSFDGPPAPCKLTDVIYAVLAALGL